jgi:hypothetical protein
MSLPGRGCDLVLGALRGALATWHGVSLSRAAGESAVTKAARELAEIQSPQFAVIADTERHEQTPSPSIDAPAAVEHRLRE